MGRGLAGGVAVDDVCHPLCNNVICLTVSYTCGQLREPRRWAGTNNVILSVSLCGTRPANYENHVGGRGLIILSVSLCGTRPASCENHVGGRGLIMSFVGVSVWRRPDQQREPSAGGGRGLIMSFVCVSVWHTPGQLREPSAGGGRGLILSLKLCLCQCVAHARPTMRTLCRWWAGTNIVVKIVSVSVCGTRPANYENPLQVVGGD